MPPPKVSLVPVMIQCNEERCMAVRPGFVRLVNKTFKGSDAHFAGRPAMSVKLRRQLRRRLTIVDCLWGGSEMVLHWSSLVCDLDFIEAVLSAVTVAQSAFDAERSLCMSGSLQAAETLV